MKFSKQPDGRWHWDCEVGYQKGHGILYGIGWGIMLIPMIIGTFAADPHFQKPLKDLLICGGMWGMIGIILLCCWLTDRFGKTKYSFIADENGWLKEDKGSKNQRTVWIRFETIVSLEAYKEQNMIVAEVSATESQTKELHWIYASAQDYDAVWRLFKEHCPQARIISTITLNGKRVSTRRKQSLEQNYSLKRGALGTLALLLGIFAIVFTIAWMRRGPKISEFSGEGSAQIYSIEHVQSSVQKGYHYTAFVTIEGNTTYYSHDHKGSMDWSEGDIVPVVYNVKNPSLFVVGMTPKEYGRWYVRIKRVIIAMWIAFVLCILQCIWLDRAVKREKNNRPKQEKNR